MHPLSCYFASGLGKRFFHLFAERIRIRGIHPIQSAPGTHGVSAAEAMGYIHRRTGRQGHAIPAGNHRYFTITR